jgi:hypothetical protein
MMKTKVMMTLVWEILPINAKPHQTILAPLLSRRQTRRQPKPIHGPKQVNTPYQVMIRCAHVTILESKPTQLSSSWFSRWWNKEGPRGPTKATLGEESSFVYDKELKRWVNKKVGSDCNVVIYVSDVQP